MKIIEREVKTFEVDLACDCGHGFYRPTGKALMTSPVKYPHKCASCGDEKRHSWENLPIH